LVSAGSRQFGDPLGWMERCLDMLYALRYCVIGNPSSIKNPPSETQQLRELSAVVVTLAG
jgi:hypothetical protein